MLKPIQAPVLSFLGPLHQHVLVNHASLQQTLLLLGLLPMLLLHYPFKSIPQVTPLHDSTLMSNLIVLPPFVNSRLFLLLPVINQPCNIALVMLKRLTFCVGLYCTYLNVASRYLHPFLSHHVPVTLIVLVCSLTPTIQVVLALCTFLASMLFLVVFTDAPILPMNTLGCDKMLQLEGKSKSTSLILIMPLSLLPHQLPNF